MNKKKLKTSLFILVIFINNICNCQTKKLITPKVDINVILSNTQPKIQFKTSEKLENFLCSQNTFYWINMKAAVTKNGQIIIVGFDSLKQNIHVYIRDTNLKKSKHLYVKNPFLDSIDLVPQITSLNLKNDSNEFVIVIDKKFVIILEIANNALIIKKINRFNSPTNRPYNSYYYYKYLYGIYPVYGLRNSKNSFTFKDSLSFDMVYNGIRKNIYYYQNFNPEFWDIGMSSYISSYEGKVAISNALRNEIVILNIKENKIDTVKNLIPNFKEIDSIYKDSIYRMYNGNNIPFRLIDIMDKRSSFNYIFKIMMRSENEIWLIWKGYDKEPEILKLDIIKYENGKGWKNKFHKLIYNYSLSNSEENITISTYPLDFFNNLTYLSNDRLYIISNDNLNFNPLNFSFKETKELRKKFGNTKSLKFYEFKLIDF